MAKKTSDIMQGETVKLPDGLNRSFMKHKVYRYYAMIPMEWNHKNANALVGGKLTPIYDMQNPDKDPNVVYFGQQHEKT